MVFGNLHFIPSHFDLFDCWWLFFPSLKHLSLLISYLRQLFILLNQESFSVRFSSWLEYRILSLQRRNLWLFTCWNTWTLLSSVPLLLQATPRKLGYLTALNTIPRSLFLLNTVMVSIHSCCYVWYPPLSLEIQCSTTTPRIYLTKGLWSEVKVHYSILTFISGFVGHFVFFNT